MFRLKLLAIFLVAIAALAPTTGCAALQKVMPQVVHLIQDAALIVDQIDSFQGSYFKAHPNASLEAKVDESVERVRLALVALERAADGAASLTDKAYLNAVGAFRAAYEALLAACAGIPGLNVVKSGDSAKAGPETLNVPEPLLLAPQ